MIKPEIVKAYRKLLVGILTVEYAMVEIKGDSYFELKHRVNKVLRACKEVQDHFTHHPTVKLEHREIFKREFNKSEMFMLSELLETVYGINDEGLEIIINAVKAQLLEPKVEEVT